MNLKPYISNSSCNVNLFSTSNLFDSRHSWVLENFLIRSSTFQMSLLENKKKKIKEKQLKYFRTQMVFYTLVCSGISGFGKRQFFKSTYGIIGEHFESILFFPEHLLTQFRCLQKPKERQMQDIYISLGVIIF